MKPAAFAYHDPQTVDEALEILSQVGDDGKILAGGQSLVPMMNFRLARPSDLVDLNRIAALSYVRIDDGQLRIGAMTRQRHVEHAAAVGEGWPLLTGAIEHIGHVQIRNRGTIGGSLAHADPAAELPAVMSALEAEIVVRGTDGELARADVDPDGSDRRGDVERRNPERYRSRRPPPLAILEQRRTNSDRLLRLSRATGQGAPAARHGKPLVTEARCELADGIGGLGGGPERYQRPRGGLRP